MNLLKQSLVLSLCAALVLSVPATLVGQAASPSHANPAPQRPKLVVVMVIDQCRADFLDRFRDRFGPGGFNRLMREGAYFSECFYPYAVTETGPGHATLATGTTPDRHGIAANDWYDFQYKKLVEAAEDEGRAGGRERDPETREHGRAELVRAEDLAVPAQREALEREREASGRVEREEDEDGEREEEKDERSERDRSREGASLRRLHQQWVTGPTGFGRGG